MSNWIINTPLRQSGGTFGHWEASLSSSEGIIIVRIEFCVLKPQSVLLRVLAGLNTPEQPQ